jgi:hypothetical protein
MLSSSCALPSFAKIFSLKPVPVAETPLTFKRLFPER